MSREIVTASEKAYLLQTVVLLAAMVEPEMKLVDAIDAVESDPDWVYKARQLNRERMMLVSHGVSSDLDFELLAKEAARLCTKHEST